MRFVKKRPIPNTMSRLGLTEVDPHVHNHVTTDDINSCRFAQMQKHLFHLITPVRIAASSVATLGQHSSVLTPSKLFIGKSGTWKFMSVAVS